MSNFVMPEATAVFLLTLSMLLAYLAARSGQAMAAVAALTTALRPIGRPMAHLPGHLPALLALRR